MSALQQPSVLLVGNFLGHTARGLSVGEDLAPRLQAAGWRVATTSTQEARVRRLADMLATVWSRRADYDVAHVDVYSGPAFIWAEAVVALLRALGKPHVLTLHGGELPRFAERWPRRVRRLLAAAAAVTTPSAYLQQSMGASRGDLMLVPNALELARYPFRIRAPARPRLIWLRAFHALYNPSLAPRVVAGLVAEYPDVELTMVGPDRGDGALEASRREAIRLGVQEHIRWVGAVPKREVPVWMDRGDIFLNTTNVDNTPVSVLEALACGLCVVSTSAGGMPDLVRDGEEALLVPLDDAAAMTAAVAHVLRDRAHARSLSLSARARAAAVDWAAVMPRWDGLLRDAAGRAA